MIEMQELPAERYVQIQRIAEAGDELASDGNLDLAVAKYKEAWALVPEPKHDWEASTWLLVAIGDSCFLGKWYRSGAEAFRYALRCPDGFGNPFVHLRLGQCAFELMDFEAATEHLLRAYALEGTDVFASDSPKYFEFLQSRVEPPAGGAW